MSEFDFKRYEQAIQLAADEGNNAAVNSLSAIYTEAKTKEKAEFVDYKPSTPDDLLNTLTEAPSTIANTITGGIDETQQLYDEGMLLPTDVPAIATVKAILPAAGDVFTTGLKVAGHALSNAIPDTVEEYTMESLASIAYDIAETPLFKEGLEAAKESYGSFLKWKENYPQEALRLGAGFELALMGVPATKVPPVSATLDKWGWEAKNAGKLQGIDKRHDIVTQILAPVKLERKDIRRTNTNGILGTITTTPDAMEQEVINVVSLIPKVKGRNNPIVNANAVYDEIDATAHRLINRLKLKGNPAIDRTALNTELDDEVAKYFGGNASVVGIASPKKMQAILDQAKEFINASDGTAVGILQARKDLDKWLQGIEPKMVNDEYMDSKAKALKIIRESMNKAVDTSVPDVDVSGLLRKQYLMYKAYDNLADKSIGLARTSLARAYVNAKRVTGVAIPTTPLAIAATSSAATMALTSGWLAFATGTLALGAGAAVTARMLKGPTAKKGLGVLLGNVSKAIKLSKSKEMIEQLKADRLVIISLLEQKEDPDQRIPMKGAANGA